MDTLRDQRALEVALKVLQACVYGRVPDKTDVAYLREFSNDASTPCDELACQVVRVITDRRTPDTVSRAANGRRFSFRD